VPEPATWRLLAIACGFAGASSRSRNRTNVAY
jgi:hypothetical protein